MTSSLISTAILTAAYFTGSLPTALIVSTRIKRVDIRNLGDGNMGATNTFHEIGPEFGVLVFLFDFLKGFVPVLLAYLLGFSLVWGILIGVAAILGHSFPIFAGFKGGLGTATSFGAITVLYPASIVVGAGFYGFSFLIVRNSDKSLIVCSAAIVGLLAFARQWGLLATVISVLMFIQTKKTWVDRAGTP